MQGSIPAGTAVFLRDNQGFVLTEYVLTRVYCIIKRYNFCVLKLRKSAASSIFQCVHTRVGQNCNEKLLIMVNYSRWLFSISEWTEKKKKKKLRNLKY